jgi:hypothetical protein
VTTVAFPWLPACPSTCAHISSVLLSTASQGLTHWTVMVQHLYIGAPVVEHLETPDQVHEAAPESFWDMPCTLASCCRGWELDCYFLFAKGVVLKPLDRLCTIYSRCKRIVKPKLSGKHIHHDVYDALVMLAIRGRCVVLGGKAIQNI